MKYIYIFTTMLALAGFNGCATSKSYYVLSVANTPSTVYQTKHAEVIGIEKLRVPSYMYKREIAIADSPHKITLLGNALWGEDLDEGLTNRLIGYCQKKFNLPNVYGYPWGIDKQPDIKVSVQITRFIAQGDRVYLDATWSLENMRTKQHKARLFSTSVPTKNDVESIVSAMNKAFSEFEESVAVGIKKF